MAEFKYTIARNVVLAAIVFSIIIAVAVYAPIALSPGNGVISSSETCLTSLSTINNNGIPMPGWNNLSQRYVEAFQIPIPCYSDVEATFEPPTNNSFNLYNFSGTLLFFQSANIVQCSQSVGTSSAKNTESISTALACPGILLNSDVQSGHFSSSQDQVTVNFGIAVSSVAIPGLYFLEITGGGCATVVPILIGTPQNAFFPANFSSICSGEYNFPLASVDSLTNFSVTSVSVQLISNETVSTSTGATTTSTRTQTNTTSP